MSVCAFYLQYYFYRGSMLTVYEYYFKDTEEGISSSKQFMTNDA